MGHPVVTRLGLNQFWYKHWYNDISFHNSIKEDNLITDFISFYLNHGTLYQSNVFLHEYWYNTASHKSLTDDYRRQSLQCFRRYFYTNTRLGIEHSYLIRYHTGEYFPMRLWLMRFGGWLFLSVHWFKPLKSNKSRKFKKKAIYVNSVSRSTSSPLVNKRLILIKSWLKIYGLKTYNYEF